MPTFVVGSLPDEDAMATGRGEAKEDADDEA
jgi:hypothetical protein